LERGELIEGEFDYMDVDCHRYKDISFEKIVFCDGAACGKNPYFNHLPFSFNKGEILTIKSPELKLNEIYKKKFFILPLGNDLYRVGATYEREFEVNYDADEKRQQMIEQFKEIFNCDFELVDQLSGVRPAVRDRRPLIGKHPVLSNFYLFNGLGSRGCLMAPKLSSELIELMENEVPIKAEIDLNRVNRDN
jgi:glycine/D-amino acid oxidase-like deaminating enzyme